jgi:ribose transport system substrate-binding protein
MNIKVLSMRRSTTVLLSLVIAVGISGGCNRSSQPSGSDGGTATGGSEKLLIAVIPKSTGGEFWETVETGARQAAADLDVEIKWEGTLTETEIAEQNKIIENMINLGVDGMALAPLNTVAMRKPVQNVTAAGIPVVIFDSAVEGDAHVSFVATHNKRGGSLGAEQLVQLMGDNRGPVMVMRFVQGTGSCEARAEGFIETVEAAGFKVAADPYPEDGTAAGCIKTASNTLEGFVKDGKLAIGGIFACNDRATLGVLAALNDLRKSGIKVDAKFVGFDFNPKLVASLQDGKIDALVSQDPNKMGYLAVETIVHHLRGQKIEPFTDTGVELVTKERLDKEPKIRKLVGLEK